MKATTKKHLQEKKQMVKYICKQMKQFIKIYGKSELEKSLRKYIPNSEY